MSTGLRTFRCRTFQSRTFRPRTLAGPAGSVAPVDRDQGITRLRTMSPYVGGLYGSFDRSRGPDFLRGFLCVYPYVVGEVNMRPTLQGEIETNP